MSDNQKNVLLVLLVLFSAYLVFVLMTGGDPTGASKSLGDIVPSLGGIMRSAADSIQQTGDYVPPTSGQSTIYTAPQFAPTAAVIWPFVPCQPGENATETGCLPPENIQGCPDGKCPDDN